MASYTQQDNPQGPVASNSLKPLVAYTRSTLIIADKLHDILRVRADGNMIRDTSDERLRSLKEDLQRARAEQERHRTLRKAETDAERQAREEAAKGRHEDTMSQLRAMRELLQEQRESQAKQVEEMEQRHAEQVQRRGTTLGQISDLQAAVTSLRDERQAHSEQLAEKHSRAKAGGYSSTHCVSDKR